MDIINKRTLEENNVDCKKCFREQQKEGGVGNLKSYDYLQTQRDWGERMCCHYLNIVIIKMYINNMFCDSLQLIEPQLETRE